MDLVAGVRKEGSRGGRDAFKWEDVKDDQHRENYLGHSLMAPVGRWQRNKDLSWYAKGDTSQAAADAANARKEEIRRIKEAEQDALSEALGFKVEPRLSEHQVAGVKEVQRAIKEAAADDDEGEGAEGLGFGAFAGVGVAGAEEVGERMLGYVGENGGLESGREKGEKRSRRRRSRSRDKRRRREDRERGAENKRIRVNDDDVRRDRRERDGERYHRHRSPFAESRREDERYSNHRRRERSYSPNPRRRERSRDRTAERRR